MIKVLQKDSIVDIIIKITQSKEKQIVLEFPFGHPVLHNATSLKILKTKADKKDLVIITSDQSAKNIGEKLGIRYSLVSTPDIVEYNFSIAEYLQFVVKNYKQEFFNFLSNKKNYGKIYDYKERYFKQKSRIGFFLFGAIISLFLLVFIFYFAVNKTYIYITPDISIKTKAKNLTFQHINSEGLQSIGNENIIPLRKQEKLIYLEEVFASSGVDNSNISTAKGRVSLYNKTIEPIGLRPNSRLQAPNGSIYVIDKSITIPAGTYSSSGTIIPGTKEVLIESKIHNISGEISGSLANIDANTFLFFPGLSDQKDEIYGITKSAISGAKNDYIKIVSESDIANAKQILEKKLRNQALKNLKKDIKLLNETNNVEYQILGVDGVLKYSNLELNLEPGVSKGDKRENFRLSGSIRVKTYSYNKQEVLSKLKNTIQESLLEEIEKVLYINEDSLRISHKIYQNDVSPFTLKATAQVEVFYIHNFLNTKNNYVEKLKNMIGGLPQEEAENFLINNPKISNVDIEIQPFFINNISKIPDNIIFRIVEK